MVFVWAWLALCVVATAAYVFGASVGYRRGIEDATQQHPGEHMPPAGARSPDIAVELRLARTASDGVPAPRS